jgi:hypothetical protein
MTTSLTAIHADTDERYEFSLVVHGVLPVRVVVSVIFGDLYGAHAVVETGEEYPDAEAYLVNTNLFPLNGRQVQRSLWALATKVERELGELPEDRVRELAERFAPAPSEEPAEYDEPVYDWAEEAAYRAEQERGEYLSMRDAERAYAEDRERMAEEGSWFGRYDRGDADDLPF